jgi:HD-GYP domain-containing protein (c-di-GMP phosphodiesterase class II)
MLQLNYSPHPSINFFKKHNPLLEVAVGSSRIVLASLSPPIKTWSATTHMRIGRLPDLEVVIDDVSISRRHAELVLVEEGWVLRDFGSMNGTHLNGVRIGRTPQRIRQGDTIRVGSIDIRVEVLHGQPATIRIGGQRTVQVEAASRRSWDEAVESFSLSDDRWQRDGKAFLQLMRAGYRLAHAVSPEEQFQRFLDEAVIFFGAQRGGIFLADSNSQLMIRATAVHPDFPITDRSMSKTPAARAFTGRESLLFKDCQQSAELQASRSVAQGSMASIICAVLRSPDRPFGVLHLDRGILQEPFTETDLYLADSLAAALALGVERIQMIERQQELFLHTVTALAQAVEMRDSYTGDHTHRVTTYSLMLAEELGLPAEQRQLLRAAAALHDIGKIGIDDGILRKPGRLSEIEFTQMKTHVTRGSEIIQMIPGLAWALPVVRGHHERWDGAGYPDRLKGDEIPLAARVVAVADAFDAMTSDRPYRRGMTASAAFAELDAGAGKQFDPTCVEAFMRARPRIEALLTQETAFRQQAEQETGTMTVQELRRQTSGETPGPARLTATPAPLEQYPIVIELLMPP